MVIIVPGDDQAPVDGKASAGTVMIKSVSIISRVPLLGGLIYHGGISLAVSYITYILLAVRPIYAKLFIRNLCFCFAYYVILGQVCLGLLSLNDN